MQTTFFYHSTFYLFLLFISFSTQAQQIDIRFSPTGESNTIDTIEIKNIESQFPENLVNEAEALLQEDLIQSVKTLAKNLKQIYFDATQVTDEEVDALWQMMTHNNGKSVIHQTTQYIKQRKQFWHRWIGALQQTQLPVHVLWAENDPVAVIEMAQVLSDEISNATLTTLPALGHFPMAESPDRWGQAVVEYLLNA